MLNEHPPGVLCGNLVLDEKCAPHMSLEALVQAMLLKRENAKDVILGTNPSATMFVNNLNF